MGETYQSLADTKTIRPFALKSHGFNLVPRAFPFEGKALGTRLPRVKLVRWYPSESHVVSRLVLNYAHFILLALFMIPIEQVALVLRHLFSNTILLVNTTKPLSGLFSPGKANIEPSIIHCFCTVLAFGLFLCLVRTEIEHIWKHLEGR